MLLKCLLFSFILIFVFCEEDDDENATGLVGGVDAEEYEFPFVVSLRYDGYHICGGSILNEKFVLTAAHCVCHDDDPKNASDYSIQYGLTKLTNDSENVIHVNTIHCNRFNTSDLLYDSAVIELQSPLPECGWDPVEISKDFKYQNETNGTILGWSGTSAGSTLQKLQVIIYDDDFCREHFNPAHEICVGSDGGACRGDSGSPLLVDNVQVGIASYITNECGIANETSPNIYSRVARYYDWITEIAGLEDK